MFDPRNRRGAPGRPGGCRRCIHRRGLRFSFFFWSTCALSAIQSFASPALQSMYGLPLSVTALVVTGYMLCGAAGMVVGCGPSSATYSIDASRPGAALNIRSCPGVRGHWKRLAKSQKKPPMYGSCRSAS